MSLFKGLNLYFQLLQKHRDYEKRKADSKKDAFEI